MPFACYQTLCLSFESKWSQLLYFSRLGEAAVYTKAQLPCLALAKLLLCLLLSRLLARRLKVLFAKSTVVSAKKGIKFN